MFYKDESVKNFVCREMSFLRMLTIIPKLYWTNFSVKLLSKWWIKMLPVTYEVPCDSLEDILHEMLVCTYCSFRCNVWCHFLRVSGRSHFRNIFVLISYILLYVYYCVWVTYTGTTELTHNHPSQTPQMLGRKEIYTMQIVFLLDVLKHFCSFYILQNHLFSNS